MVTGDQISQIMPHLSRTRRDAFLPHLCAGMEEFLISTMLREAAFLAQLAHESGELRYMEEIASGARYEGRIDLGNTQRGDGRRFKGRGPIQLTGRANYVRYGKLLALDLVGNPATVALPEVGFRVAGLFWKLNGLNERADAQAFDRITRRINGGTNGAADRWMYYERAKIVLAPGEREPDSQPRVVVNSVEVTAAKAYLLEGTLMVAVRPVAKAAGLRILDAAKGRAILQNEKKANYRVPLAIHNGVGYVALRALPGKVGWDAATLTGSLETE